MKRWLCPSQFGSGLYSNRDGFEDIDDWLKHIKTLPTIEDELNQLPKPDDMKKAIYVVHCPPAHVGLDVCMNGQKVGSHALYKFIEDNQPLLTLHGHIHESPQVTKTSHTRIGDAISIQPGQMRDLVYAGITVENGEVKHFVKGA